MTDKPVQTLLQFIDGTAEIWIKYTYHIKVDRSEYYEESTVIDGYPGSVIIRSFTPKQRFYSNLRMVECRPDRLEVDRSGGRRIIRIRDIIFVDAQLYVKNMNRVLKMNDDNGFIGIKIPEAEYRSVIKQLRKGS